MNIEDIIYFAPGIKIVDLDFDDRTKSIAAFEKRIEAYYLMPIGNLNHQKHAFASGLLLMSLIDSLARYSSNVNVAGKRITSWLMNNIDSLRPLQIIERKEICRRIYDEFRCGLIHESHIKNGGQFSYEIDHAILKSDGFVIINPTRLEEEIRKNFYAFRAQLETDNALFEIFISRMRIDFEKERDSFRRLVR